MIIGLLAVFSTCVNLQSPSRVRRTIEEERQERRRRRDLVTAEDLEPKAAEPLALSIELRYSA